MCGCQMVARETPELIDHEFLLIPILDFQKFLLPLKLHDWQRAIFPAFFTLEIDLLRLSTRVIG